jgi:hypothetical protein
MQASNPRLLERLLEQLPELASFRAVPAEWQERLSPHCFKGLPGGFLANTHMLAKTVPCRHPVSCFFHHDIKTEKDGRLIAQCQSGRKCEPFEITQEDRVVWKLNIGFILKDVAETLSLEPSPEGITDDLWRLGTITKYRVPAFVSFAISPSDHRKNAAIVAAQRNASFVFFVPTASSQSQPVQDTVTAANGRFGILADHLGLDERPSLFATLELTERRKDLGKEPAHSIPPVGFKPNTSWGQIVVTIMKNGRIGIAHRDGNPYRFYTRDELGFLCQNGSERCQLIGCIPIGPSKKSVNDARNRAREISDALRRATKIDGIAFDEDTRPVKQGADAPRWDSDEDPRSSEKGFWPCFKLRGEEERLQLPGGNYHPPPDSPEVVDEET